MTHAGVFKSYAIGEILNTPEADETPGGVKVTHFDLLVRPSEDEDQTRGTRLHCSAWRGAAIAALKQLEVGMLVWVEGRISNDTAQDGSCYLTLNVTLFRVLTDTIDADPPDYTIGAMPTSGDNRDTYSVRHSKERTASISILSSGKKLPPKPGTRR